MTSYFPDLNVWLALADPKHKHNTQTWAWFESLPHNVRVLFSRYTQMGLLRLLTSQGVMGAEALTLRQAWTAYDGWLADARIHLLAEPRNVELLFREATTPYAGQAASNMVGDCYLLAYAEACGAVLVTFDKGLLGLARERGFTAISPA